MFLFQLVYRKLTTFPPQNLRVEEKLEGKFDMPLREWLVQVLYLS